jgi:hypothetical protein
MMEKLCAKDRQVVFPRGRSIGSRVPVYCYWISRAVTSDHGEEQRSKRSCVESP